MGNYGPGKTSYLDFSWILRELEFSRFSILKGNSNYGEQHSSVHLSGFFSVNSFLISLAKTKTFLNYIGQLVSHTFSINMQM